MTKSIVDFILEAQKLKRVVRTGWSIAGVKNPESVADHSWGLALLCMLVADKKKIDVEKLIKMAIIDDLAEVETGDLVRQRGNKVLMDRQEKLAKERKVINKLFGDLENGQQYIDLWEEAQGGETEEAKLLKQLDKLETAMQALAYKDETDPEKLDEFFVNVRKNITDRELVAILDDVEQLRRGD